MRLRYIASGKIVVSVVTFRPRRRRSSPIPGDKRHALIGIEELSRPRLEAVACEHLFGGACRDLGEYRPAAGQPYAGPPRQIEDIIAVEEHPEYLRTADDGEDS